MRCIQFATGVVALVGLGLLAGCANQEANEPESQASVEPAKTASADSAQAEAKTAPAEASAAKPDGFALPEFVVTAEQEQLRDQLLAALQEQDFDRAEKLIEDGADVNAPIVKDKGQHQRLLHSVCNSFSGQFADRSAAARFLLEHGADPNARNSDGWPPMAEAIWSGEAPLLPILKEHGADLTVTMPMAKNPRLKDLTLLHIAAMKNRPQPVAWLLEQGLDVNAQDSSGNTALMTAATGARAGVVEVLLAHGADKELRNNRGRSALDEARRDRESHKNDPVNLKAIDQTIALLESPEATQAGPQVAPTADRPAPAAETPSDGPGDDPKAVIGYQMQLLKAGDKEKLLLCFSEDLREMITDEVLKQGQQELAEYTLDDLVDSVELNEERGQKEAVIKMKNGRTLTTLIHKDGQWLADTIWFK